MDRDCSDLRTERRCSVCGRMATKYPLSTLWTFMSLKMAQMKKVRKMMLWLVKVVHLKDNKPSVRILVRKEQLKSLPPPPLHKNRIKPQARINEKYLSLVNNWLTDFKFTKF